MNILVIAHYQNDGSPNAIFVHNQVKAIKTLRHNIRVVCPIAIGKLGYTSKRFEPILTKQIIDGIPIYYVRYLSLSKYGQYGFNVLSAYCSILRIYKDIFDDFLPDIIHAHTIPFDGSIANRLGGKINVPVVITTHGSDLMQPIVYGKSIYIKKICDSADYVVCVSSMLKSKLQEIGTTKNLSIIHNGFAVDSVKAANKRPFSFLHVGNLIKQKNTDVTIKAFAQIVAVHSSASLAIIGSGPEESALRNLVAELGITNRVCFLGQVANELVLQKMAETEFFVMPSVHEGFGVVYLEAMASGCVTIGTQGEGISDLIISGGNGILVPPDDVDAIVAEVLHCMDNRNYAATLAAAGKEVALSLTWKQNANKYLTLFQDLSDKKLSSSNC